MSRKRRPKTKLILGAALAVVACYGQSFEVVSIKPLPLPQAGQSLPFRMSGGPGSPSPGLFSCQNCSLFTLVMRAYGVKPYQLSGTGGLGAKFIISAKVPAGTSKEDFLIMQQNLLAERFQLKIHREQKEMQVYELVVAKNGSKLKEAAPESPLSAGTFPDFSSKRDRNGFPELAPGAHGPVVMKMPGDLARMKARGVTIDQFIDMLSVQAGKPVTDGTGLQGKYDLTLAWAPDSEGGPTLMGALQDQLGLRLEQEKASVDIVVIDHVEKVPSEN